MPHAGLGGRSVYERAPDPETRTRVPRPCAPNSLFGTRGTIRYSKFGTRLLAVLFISALRAVCRTGKLRSPWTLRRSVPTLGSVGSKTQYL